MIVKIRRKPGRNDIMEITVNKCEHCGKLFEDVAEYAAHLINEKKRLAFLVKYPEVEEISCRFANGAWNVQRSKEWLESYLIDIPTSSDRMFICLFLRLRNVCPVCFREWGQPYFANHCDHRDKINRKMDDDVGWEPNTTEI